MADFSSSQHRTLQVSEITGDLPFVQGVCFDPDGISLQGLYGDELSLFRARRIWSETLERTFLLEKKRDFEFQINKDYDSNRFGLKCTFVSACGRYAFWRLTNNQAPEAQYEIETAHIPDSLSRHDDFVTAPDLRPVPTSAFDQEPADDVPICSTARRSDKSFSQWLHDVIERISKTL